MEHFVIWKEQASLYRPSEGSPIHSCITLNRGELQVAYIRILLYIPNDSCLIPRTVPWLGKKLRDVSVNGYCYSDIILIKFKISGES